MNIQLLLSANQGQGVASPLQLPAAGSPPLAAPMFLQVFTQATNHQSLAKADTQADTQVDAQADSMPTAPLSTSAEQLSSLDFELVEEVPQNGNAQWQSAPPMPNMQDSHAEHGTPATPLPSAAGTFTPVQTPSSEQVSSPLASSHAKQAPGITIEEVASRLTLIASYSAAPVAQSHTAPSAQSSHSATLINQHASTSKATADSQPSVESDVFSASLARTLPMPLSAPDSAPDRSMAAMATPAAQAPKPNAQLAAQRPSGALSTTASTTDSLPVAPASSMVDSAAMSQESANKAQPIASSNVAERAVDTTSLPTNTAHTQPLVLPTASTLSLEAASATASTLAPTGQLQTTAAQPTAPVQLGAQPSTQPTDQVRLPVEPATTLSPQSMADQPVANAAANLPAPATSAPSLVTAAVQPDTQPETLEHSPVEQPASALSLQTMMDRPEAKGTANSPAPAPSASSLETVAIQPQPAQLAATAQPDTQPTTQVRLPVEPAPSLQTMADLPVANEAANQPAPALSPQTMVDLPAESGAANLSAAVVQPQPAQPTAPTQPVTQARLPVEPAPVLSPQTMADQPAESGAANLSVPSAPSLETVAVQPQPTQPTAPAQSDAQPDTQPVTQVRLPVEPAPALSSQTMADLPVADGSANMPAPVQSAPAPSLETLEAVAVQPQPAQPTAPAQSNAQPDAQPTTQVRLPVEPAPALSSQTMADLPVADGAANLSAPVQSAPAPSLETLEAVAVQPQPAQPTAPAQPGTHDTQATTQVRLPVEPASALSPQTMADLPVADSAANLPAPAPSVPAPAPSLETLEAAAVQPQPTAPAQPTTQVRLPVEPAPALNSQTMADLSVVDGAANLPAPAPSAPAPSLETVAVQPQPAQSTALAQPGAQPDTQATTQVRLPVEPAPTLSINAQVMNELLAKEKAASTNYIASKSGELAFPSSPTLQRQVMPTVQASSSTGSFSAATLPLPTIFPHTQPLVLPTASSLPLEALATPANELAPTAPLETTATQPLATTQPMAQPMAQPRLTVEAALVPAGNTEAMASPLTEETVATQNKHAASQNSGVVAPVSLSPQQPVLPNSPATISLGTPVTSPSWPSQLGQQLVQFTQRGGEHQIKMQLHPAELGPLSISLKVSEQGTQAHFLTASAQARQVIELAIPQLREALAEQGISLGETSVGEQGTSGEQLFAQQESGTSRNLGSNDDREGDATATLDMSDSGSLALDGRIDLYA